MQQIYNIKPPKSKIVTYLRYFRDAFLINGCREEAINAMQDSLIDAYMMGFEDGQKTRGEHAEPEGEYV